MARAGLWLLAMAMSRIFRPAVKPRMVRKRCGREPLTNYPILHGNGLRNQNARLAIYCRKQLIPTLRTSTSQLTLIEKANSSHGVCLRYSLATDSTMFGASHSMKSPNPRFKLQSMRVEMSIRIWFQQQRYVDSWTASSASVHPNSADPGRCPPWGEFRPPL